MKILFSPSETKTKDAGGAILGEQSFIFEELYEKRYEIIKKYQEVINSSSDEDLAKIFGTKKNNIINLYKKNIFQSKTKKAIQLYDGVAYNYLKYNSLNALQQNYLDANVIIHSNIFGPVSAKDQLPDYKFKQGSKLPGINLENFYKENFSCSLDDYLGDFIIDLRAGFYEKFYTIKVPHITFKFLKNGKVLSHWAKAYRGHILKQISMHRPQNYYDLENINFDGINLLEIQKKSLVNLWIMEIV